MMAHTHEQINEETDPRYRESAYGNPQYADVEVVRAPQGPKPRAGGDTNTPLGKERLGAARPWKSKGRRGEHG